MYDMVCIKTKSQENQSSTFKTQDGYAPYLFMCLSNFQKDLTT